MPYSKLSRKKQNRERMLKNLATSIILHEKVKTTKPKALATKPVVLKLLKYAQADSLAARRQAQKIILNNKVLNKLFEEIPQRLSNKNLANIWQMVRVNNRLGDNAEMVIVNLSLKSLEELVKEEIKK